MISSFGRSKWKHNIHNPSQLIDIKASYNDDDNLLDGMCLDHI